ncbi:uncharacterized protein LOC120800036 isoform X2 [Xiphias gladius]|uniref:uncharacterized protein LOC120800036 isoform X2 n=1 Tax=Xiphias gladius TaxID=8245 RepID=UPI001A996EC3|nr:uncharacterized protein LOC120800036 isoform X2 [Xiphias gladius]
MEIPLLFLIFAMHQVDNARMNSCSGVSEKNLICYNDYSHNITCVWNSTHESDRPGAACKLHAIRVNTLTRPAYNTSCDPEPVNVPRLALQKCSLIFKREAIFQSFHELSISLGCDAAEQNLTITYKPACNIKLNPPGKPDINHTSVSWLNRVKKHERFSLYTSHLQWKKGDQSWNDPSVQNKKKNCEQVCVAELDPNLLIQGERYEARVRVQTCDGHLKSTWSDWGPTASWVSPVESSKLENWPISGVPGGLLGVTIAGVAVALFLVVILFRNEKIIWMYMVKKFRGPPLPDPAKSFLQDVNFQNWLSPHFISKSSRSSLKPEEFLSVEVTSTADAVMLCRSEAALLEKMKSESSYESTRSSYSNPSYSKLCPPPPASSPITGTPGPCAADTPNGPVGRQCEGKTTEQDREEERRKAVELQQLLSKSDSNSERVQVMSDYEKVEKLHAERLRLQSLDSGMCSGEEVSQESLEADSIGATDSHDEGPDGKGQEREGGNGKEVDFQKLFGGSGNFFGKGSIQVCSDYEQVQTLQPCSPELPSLDSGVSSASEEQVSHEESLEEVDKSPETKSFLFPPPLSCALPCSAPAFPQLPLKFIGTGLSPALRLPSPSHIGGGEMLMSRPVEPSGNGYMPVKQEQS